MESMFSSFAKLDKFFLFLCLTKTMRFSDSHFVFLNYTEDIFSRNIFINLDICDAIHAK